MELYYRINIYFLIFIVLYYTVRVYLINILENNVKLLPWHVLICVYVVFFVIFLWVCQNKVNLQEKKVNVHGDCGLNVIIEDMQR